MGFLLNITFFIRLYGGKTVTLQVTSFSRDVIVELAVLSATEPYFGS